MASLVTDNDATTTTMTTTTTTTTLDLKQKPYSKSFTLNRNYLEKQQTIESRYPSYHILIVLPENLVEKIVFEYLMASNMHSLSLSCFIKQFIIMQGGNTVNTYKKKLLGKMKYHSANNLFLEYNRQCKGFTHICVACERGDMTFMRKFVKYTSGTEQFFRCLTLPGTNTKTQRCFCSFFTAIYFGKQHLVKYLLKVDEEINGNPTLLFHRDTQLNMLHVAVDNCKDKNGFQLLLFLLDYALIHDGSILMTEVIDNDIGTVVDFALHRVANALGTLYKKGTELWYRVEVAVHLKSL